MLDNSGFRSDMYPLTATMYHALTGRVPFDEFRKTSKPPAAVSWSSAKGNYGRTAAINMMRSPRSRLSPDLGRIIGRLPRWIPIT